jgi:CBS domain-containing protein/sporulation protein YlmC with PRC-barrel domain
MLYVSQLEGQRVWDSWGQPIGRCKDVLANYVEKPFPHLLALVLKDGDREDRFICADQITSLYPSIVLNVPKDEVKTYQPNGQELWLADQMMDHQIVDIEGRRVVRVNDLQLARVKDKYCVIGVDVSGRGLLRRLGIESAAVGISKWLKRPLPKAVVSWQDIAYLQEGDPIRLSISREKISKLPAVDIATILNDLDRNTGQALLAQMDNETLADTLEESPSKTQVAILSQLDSERAADILEEMDPDEAADLLADLPEETSHQLLDLMEADEAKEMRSLLDFPEDSAGGIMTTEFAWIPSDLTASEALGFLRSSEDAQEDEEMYYVYVVDAAWKLHGVITLRDLVMAAPDEKLDELLDTRPICVGPLTPQQEVAYLVAKYDLLAVPVVKEETEEMLGIVTVDDAVDAVLPTTWKKRLPRFY